MQSTIVFPEHDDSGLQKKTHRSIEALLGVCVWCTCVQTDLIYIIIIILFFLQDYLLLA